MNIPEETMKKERIRNLLGAMAMAVFSLLLVSCGSKVGGTYSDANGSFILELRSGGQASFTFMGETGGLGSR